MDTTDQNRDKEHPVEISIDGDEYTAPERKMTANAILKLASIDPAQNYLVEKHGREQTSYKDRGDATIELHEKETFISVPIGDVTVS